MSPQEQQIFTTTVEKTVGALGENATIALISKWLGPVSPPPPVGMGDDCAVLENPTGKKQILTTDSLTNGRHFDDSVSPKNAGAKLIKRNLSDIAAMGGTPGPALLNLLMGSNLNIEWLEGFFAGIRETCEEFGVLIVGGDVSQLDDSQFTATLTLTGTTEQEPTLRTGAAIGDWLYVTGSLGGSILGKHFQFQPRLTEGRWLSQNPATSSMMDLTDGLAKDLRALLPPASSAHIEIGSLPISQDARTLAAQDDASAEEHVFSDGEDYELLFTVKGSVTRDVFESEWNERFPDLKATCIGHIAETHQAGLFIEAGKGEALPWSNGFEHFNNR